MIEVKLMPILAKRAASRKEDLGIPFVAGLTPALIAESEGFSSLDREAILAIVNGDQVDIETALHDGDRLELRVGIAGG